MGSQEPFALQRRPDPQLVAVHGAPHAEPMPETLHWSTTALQTRPPLHERSVSQPCVGAMPQETPSSGPTHASPLAQSVLLRHASPARPEHDERSVTRTHEQAAVAAR
jgi:hypothetical protein